MPEDSWLYSFVLLIWKATVSSTIDVLVVVHNSRPFIPSLIEGLRRVSVPITAYFLDNNSRDGTPEALAQSVSGLPFPVYILRSLHNNGFARGMNLLSRQGSGDFLFVLNPDTELEPGCVEKLARANGIGP